MTHDELVARAVKWLKSRPGACGIAVPELVAWGVTEQPDAIGWYGGIASKMVECKATRSDFRRDQKKPHRIAAGVGMLRYYMCEPELIMPEELPPTWGLLYCYPRQTQVKVKATSNPDRCLYSEMRMMYSLLRRVEVRGQLRRCLAPKWGGDGGIIAN